MPITANSNIGGLWLCAGIVIVGLLILGSAHHRSMNAVSSDATEKKKQKKPTRGDALDSLYGKKMAASSTLVSPAEFVQNIRRACGRDTSFLPDYNPDLYDSEHYEKFNNCYAYAHMDRKDDIHRHAKPQPGFKRGLKPLREQDYTPKNFIKRVMLDYPKDEFRPIEDKSECACGMYKVALFLDNKGPRQDYHWYRQDSTGFWSHKPGGTEVSHVDASGNPISDPAVADRNYDKNDDGYNYEVAVGYFCVSADPKELEINNSTLEEFLARKNATQQTWM